MKKVLTVLGGLIALMFLALPTTASNFNETTQIQSIQMVSLDLRGGGGSTASSLDLKTVKRVLTLAASQLPLTYSQLVEGYQRGLVTIQQIGVDMYEVNDGGGNVAIVVLDSL